MLLKRKTSAFSIHSYKTTGMFFFNNYSHQTMTQNKNKRVHEIFFLLFINKNDIFKINQNRIVRLFLYINNNLFLEDIDEKIKISECKYILSFFSLFFIPSVVHVKCVNVVRLSLMSTCSLHRKKGKQYPRSNIWIQSEQSGLST